MAMKTVMPLLESSEVSTLGTFTLRVIRNIILEGNQLTRVVTGTLGVPCRRLRTNIQKDTAP